MSEQYHECPDCGDRFIFIWATLNECDGEWHDMACDECGYGFKAKIELCWPVIPDERQQTLLNEGNE